MQHSRPTRSLAFFVFCALLASVNLHADEQGSFDAAQHEGLNVVKSKFFDEFSLAPTAQLSQYTKVYIAMPSVTFDKRWIKTHRRDIPERYRTQTSERYAKMLKEQLEKAFIKHGQFELASSAEGAETLTVQPKISKLDINGPDWGVLREQYVSYAGDATLTVALQNANGEALAKLKDHRETRTRNMHKPERTSRALNQRDFRFLMAKWSRQLVQHIVKY